MNLPVQCRPVSAVVHGKNGAIAASVDDGCPKECWCCEDENGNPSCNKCHSTIFGMCDEHQETTCHRKGLRVSDRCTGGGCNP